jgi:putative transposase
MLGEIRKFLGSIFHELARQKECRMIEGHWLPDHVHMCIEITPKYAVASVVGFLKGKSAIAITRQLGESNAISVERTSGLEDMPFRPLALS